MPILEPDVTLTDFALTIECSLFAAILLRGATATGVLRAAFAAFFAAAGVASLLGGITHGFLADKTTLAFHIVWTATLAAIGVAAFACWLAGARLWLAESGARRVTIFAKLLLAAYLVVVVFVNRAFVVAVLYYLPATVFLLVSFTIAYWHRPTRFLLHGIAGMMLTFVAAGIQQGEIGLHPVYFNHNALYHVVQGVALALIFLAARGLLQNPAAAVHSAAV